MDPAALHLSFEPPPETVFARGLLPALLVNAALLAVLVLGSTWTPPWADASGLRARLLARSQAAPAAPPPAVVRSPAQPRPGADDDGAAQTARMGAAPAETAVALPQRPAADVAATRAPGPSFDCARARSRNERLICADTELAGLDRALGGLHVRAREAAPDKVAFKVQSERAWRERERSCSDRDCLLAWFAQRREVLQAQLGTQQARRP